MLILLHRDDLFYALFTMGGVGEEDPLKLIHNQYGIGAYTPVSRIEGSINTIEIDETQSLRVIQSLGGF